MALMLGVQILAGALMPARAEAGTVAVGTRIEICTASGLMVLELGPDGQPVSSPTPAGFCVFCLPLLHGAALTQAPLAMAEPVALATDTDDDATVLSRHVAHPPLAGAASPQAPPSL